MTPNSRQSYYFELIRGERKGFSATLLRGILRVASALFGMVVSLRNWLYDRQWLKSESSLVPLVLSVGNITAGGTGKTPVTLMLAQEFNNTRLAILSRGYKSPAEKRSTPTLLSRGSGPQYPAKECGDEPFLLASRLPKAIVIVGKNRRAGAAIAKELGVEAILLDDGLQHRSLKRDFDIVVMNASDLFGQGFLLPRGLLRDPITSLRRADLIVVNHVLDSAHALALEQKIRPFTAAPVVGTQMAVASVKTLEGRSISLTGKQVSIFCGIAHPQQFRQQVEALGAHVVNHHYLSDHGSFDTDALLQFSEACRSKGAQYLICTEKDRVKLSPEHRHSLEIAYLEMHLRMISGEEHWKAFVAKAKAKLATVGR